MDLEAEGASAGTTSPPSPWISVWCSLFILKNQSESYVFLGLSCCRWSLRVCANWCLQVPVGKKSWRQGLVVVLGKRNEERETPTEVSKLVENPQLGLSLLSAGSMPMYWGSAQSLRPGGQALPSALLHRGGRCWASPRPARRRWWSCHLNPGLLASKSQVL